MAVFIDRLVNTRCIPIPQLLLAFGIDLVRFVLNSDCDHLMSFVGSGTKKCQSESTLLLPPCGNVPRVGLTLTRKMMDVISFTYRLRNRDKLPEYNTIKDAVDLIRNSKRILILTGAGISNSRMLNSGP